MKTPQAILIGLALIAAAIYFQEPPVKPAYADEHRFKNLRLSCWSGERCVVLDGETLFYLSEIGRRKGPILQKMNWTNGDAIR